jgi:hypothetical protein
MKRAIATLLIVAFLAPTLAAVGGDKAAYFGGSVAIFSGAKDPLEGRLDTVNEEFLILRVDKKPFQGQELRIPYARIEDLEYGQKAGRRVGAAIGYTVLLGPLGLLTLFSKKRNHYLTVSWKDDKEQEQVAVIELGKDIVRATLPIVKARSGKEIVYQDEEARKSSGT